MPEVSASTQPVIVTENIVRTYDLGEVQVRALRGITVTIDRGDFVAIMGTSGSGKSTFMNTLGCLDQPTSGRYLLDGIDVAGMPANELARVRNRMIGFVFQGFNLLTRTSALENVEVPMMYASVPTRQRYDRAMKMLERVGLSKREHHHPSQLSGGQQQRVAIARALVNEPAVLLADEPTGNLDSRTSLEIVQLFQELNRTGLTIVVVTHEPDVAAYAKRIITFRDGRVMADKRNVPRDAKTAMIELEREEAELARTTEAVE